MGLNLMFSSCSCDEPIRAPAPQVNPDPTRFNIRHVEAVGKYLVVLVHYPDCTNYEGKKILLFRDLTEERLRKLTRIDPHFCNNSAVHPSPIARFVPTQEGMTMAIATALMLDKEMK